MALNLQRRFVDELDSSNFQDQVVTVEFSCGEALKKATGRLNLIGRDFVELVAINQFHNVTIQIFIPGTDMMTPLEETALRILIPIRNICSVEEAVV